ncbi:hypothetical protein AB0N56_36745 [Streptomyces microflavus]|uniref:hypothetical protein n=1 Tax=Streptomyces griseus group TaxID=629295 RepID=UPI00224F182C|nr:hypothetical protein [Streptomyces microflavus]MCX4657268.1 hypothetical protein [Streptomyces microflavus]
MAKARRPSTPGTAEAPPPVLELRLGGLHLTVQRLPPWLLVAAAGISSAGGVAWFGH